MTNIVPIEVGYNLGQITNNLSAVKESVQAYCDDFKNVVVTEDTVKDGKQMLANIRKEKKVLDDQRKEIKTAWNAPYMAFEKEVKEVISLYDIAIDGINEQVQELEEQRKEAKRSEIAKMFLSIDKPEEIGDWIRLNDIYDQRWENATAKMKDIQKAMDDAFATLHMAYKTIKMMNHPYEEDGLRVLRDKRDLQLSIQKMNELKEQEEIIKAKESQESVPIPAIEEDVEFEDIPFDAVIQNTFEIIVIVENNDRLEDLKLFLASFGYDYTVKEK